MTTIKIFHLSSVIASFCFYKQEYLKRSYKSKQNNRSEQTNWRQYSVCLFYNNICISTVIFCYYYSAG